MKLCKKCVLPDTFPGISFNEEGICRFCQSEAPVDSRRKKRQNLLENMESVFNQVRRKKEGEYDAIVAFSGGKDSTLTLLKLSRDYGLRCLAVTVNNGFIPEETLQNCHVVTDALGVDFVWYTPAFPFVKNMFVKSIQGKPTSPAAIKRGSQVCASCINLINNHMIKLALQTDTPIVAGGYVGGQVPAGSAVLEINPARQEQIREATLSHYQSNFGSEARKYFGLSKELLEKTKDRNIYLVNPMLTFQVPESEVIQEIKKIGWVAPQNTGLNSTNCMLNDLGVKTHFDRYGFHPYAEELSDLVRKAIIPRQEALKRVGQIPEYAQLQDQLKKLEVKETDLS
ncbi:MAG: hypothetical protein COB67_00995 [SAR324 cluster bacterium]|uniref:Uncharacterized protein n=1 Tax=SAR324 cluster bacterium TaxID=2024889 RepID=A0A2A4TB52_9DELT|nr:MAG: hypothetical protein COB67_00995 [SAR324 cluster bacterium]